MRVKISGTTITDVGDDLAAPYVEFPRNAPPAPFPTGWTVTADEVTGVRSLIDPDGQVVSVETPSDAAGQAPELLEFNLAASQSFTIKNAAGDPIFRVDEDGSVHAGATAMTADL